MRNDVSAATVQQQQRPERARQHQGAELDAGRTECRHRHRQQHRQHRLLSADDGTREPEQRQERRDRAELRQQIDAEDVSADRPERDIGEPERQRRAEIGPDLIFAAEGDDRGEVAGRASIQQCRHDQPQRCLRQHHDPDHQPRPGADQFDHKRSETHQELLPRNQNSPHVAPPLFSEVRFQSDTGK